MILNWSSTFKRAFKKTIKNSPESSEKIIAAIKLLEENPFHPKLKSHKLTGILEGNWSCSAAFDLRIIFTFVQNPSTTETEKLLINVGTHEEVY